MEASKLSKFLFSFYTFNLRAPSFRRELPSKVRMFDFVPQWRTDLLSLAAGLQSDESQMVGAFSSVFGPQNLAVLVWRHKHIDRAAQLSSNLQTSPAGKRLCWWLSLTSSSLTAGQAFLSGALELNTKLMSPQPFSPWK